MIAPSAYDGGTDGGKSGDSVQGGAGVGPASAGAETKRKYRRHPKADENAPERPPSAYVIFSNKVREEVKDQNLSFTQIAKLVGDRWQKSDPSGKEPFEAQANSAKEKYNIELSTYKKTEAYKEYLQYLADFKAKHGGMVEQKRARLDPESSASGGSVVSGKSMEVAAELLPPAQGHLGGSSTGSMASTAVPSPSSHQGSGLSSGACLPHASSRSSSPPQHQTTREFSRPGLLSTQSSTSEGSVKRSDSDPLIGTASLSLSTPPSITPPLPLPPASTGLMTDYGFGQDLSRRRFPVGGQQAGPALGTQGFPQTLPSPSMSESSWRNRGLDIRGYHETGRTLPATTFPMSGPVTGTISLPPISSTEYQAMQRTLPLPRTSPTAHGPAGFGMGVRATESSYPFWQSQGQGQGSVQAPGQGQRATQPSLDRSESDAADALAGLAGFPSSRPRPDSTKPWEQRWPR